MRFFITSILSLAALLLSTSLLASLRSNAALQAQEVAAELNGLVQNEAVQNEAVQTEATQARDQAVVEALLRLPAGALEQHPGQRTAVLRFLERKSGTAQSLDVAKRLGVLEQTDSLPSSPKPNPPKPNPPNEQIRKPAAKVFQPPATATGEPIPPIQELAKRRGNAGHGQQIFTTTGTCSKCHKVLDTGKEIGPDLSEIGSKLETLGWNFRNNWELCVDSFGSMWQSDNDDDGNRGTRINFVMEFGNYGYRDELTGDAWQVPRTGMESEIPLQHWHLNDPGVVPNILQTGAGSPTGICLYEGTLLPERFQNQIIHTDPGRGLSSQDMLLQLFCRSGTKPPLRTSQYGGAQSRQQSVGAREG